MGLLFIFIIIVKKVNNLTELDVYEDMFYLLSILLQLM